jgi:Ran-binding protein 1
MSEEQVDGADSTAEFQPIVKLEQVDVDSGEKDEKELWKSRSRLYRYAVDKTPPEWVTRGIGHVRFLKHIKNGQTRILLREGKTLKVRMNHMVQPDAPLKPKAGSEEVCFQWFAKDYAEEEPWEGLFAIKFPTPDVAQDFKKQYEAAQKANKVAASGGGVAPDPEPAPLNPAPKAAPTPQVKPKSPATSRETNNTSSDEKKETAWRKLNRSFREHMDKDIKSPNTANADWSTAMSEYLIFAHKLRNDKTTAPTRVLSSKKTVFSKLNTAFHKWATSQKDSALDADWSPPIRDYLNHAQKLAQSS